MAQNTAVRDIKYKINIHSVYKSEDIVSDVTRDLRNITKILADNCRP
jgi:hypothetical protein